jgi:hypothetical protein
VSERAQLAVDREHQRVHGGPAIELLPLRCLAEVVVLGMAALGLGARSRCTSPRERSPGRLVQGWLTESAARLRQAAATPLRRY